MGSGRYWSVQLVSGGFGWVQMISGGFRWFWVGLSFINYDYLIQFFTD